ncbi:MAG: hypothetical protein GXO91_01715, partial [FCB group bacterium]|nr:hypothetical protein [FCB group bacterium]
MKLKSLLKTMLVILPFVVAFSFAQGDPPYDVMISIDNINTSDPTLGSFDILYDSTINGGTDVAHIHFNVTGVTIDSAVNNEGVPITYNTSNGYIAWDPFGNLPAGTGVIATVYFAYSANFDPIQVLNVCMENPVAYYGTNRDIVTLNVGIEGCVDVYNPYDCSGCFGDAGGFSANCGDWYFEHCVDYDGDGLGAPGTETYYCPDTAPVPYVPDCADPTAFGEVSIYFQDLTCNGDTGEITIYYDSDVDIVTYNFNLSNIFLTAGSSPV